MSAKNIIKVRTNVPSHWVGDGFPVRTLFSYRDEGVDPFLLLDYAAPYDFPPSNGRPGVGEHPHKGFETVTIVYHGELEHRDSAGNHGAIGPGDVQWMTAASGIVHEEFHSERFSRQGGPFELVQLWVNLPAVAKKLPPRYQDLSKTKIPTVQTGGAAVRVIAGNFQQTSGPAQTFSPIELWDIQLSAGTTMDLPIPLNYTAALVVRHGNITVNDAQRLSAAGLAIFDRSGDQITVKSDGQSAALLLAGQPLNEPVVGQGPFVMNTHEEIRQAYAEYQSGAMGWLD